MTTCAITNLEISQPSVSLDRWSFGSSICPQFWMVAGSRRVPSWDNTLNVTSSAPLSAKFCSH